MKNKGEKRVKNNITLKEADLWALKKALPADKKPTNQEAVEYAVEWFLKNHN